MKIENLKTKIIEKIKSKNENITNLQGELITTILESNDYMTINLFNKIYTLCDNLDFLDDLFHNIKYHYYSCNISEPLKLDEIYIEYHNGNYYLFPNEHYYSNYDIYECHNCGELYHIDNLYYLGNYDYSVCDNCIDDYYTCEHCGEYVYTSDMNYTHDDATLCEHCYDNNTYRCDSCGEIYYREDELFYNERIDEWQCSSCYEESSSNYINSYHTSKNRKAYNFLYSKNDDINKTLTYGFELEIESKNHDIYFDDDIEKSGLLNEPMIVSLEEDSSIPNGFEIISQPFSYNYFFENGERLHTIFKNLISLDYISHNSGNCGLHFHIGNLSEQAKTNIFYFFDKHYEEIYKFSRRDNDSFCSKNHLTFKSKKAKKQKQEINKKLKEHSSHHYALVYDDKTNTLEIRIFRGTLNYTTFISNFIFINSLCEIANRSKSKITFKRIVNNVKNNELKNILIENLKKRGVAICA